MSISYEFDSDVDTVQQMLTDPEFLAERLIALGEDEPEVKVSRRGGTVTLTLKRAARRDLPKVAAKIIGEVQRFEMTEKWKADGDGWTGDYHIDVVGAPVEINASFELVPTDGGCQYTISHKPKAKIPVVGKTLEKFLVKQTAEGCERELEYLAEALG